MNKGFTLKDVRDWAVRMDEAADSIRSLEKVPARLGLIDSDLGILPASLADFERQVAGRGYAMVGSPRNIDANGRRMDARIRALLKRFWHAHGEAGRVDIDVRNRWTVLMALIEAEEGKPGSGKRWNVGRHRSLSILRARSTMAPEALTQAEIDRIGREASADKRKALRKAIAFLNSLAALTHELPGLVPFLPMARLSSPAGSARARKIDWQSLPEAFRASFEAAADLCLADGDATAKEFLARILAGEDAEAVMAEADAYAAKEVTPVGKPTAAREQYRQAVAWLVRAHEDHGGDVAALADVRDLFTQTLIEQAIRDQLLRSKVGHDLKDPLASTTLESRLVNLTTLAKRGLKDLKAVAILKLLGRIHYETPRAKLKHSSGDSSTQRIVDQLFDAVRRQPALFALWADAPRRITDLARPMIEAARAAGDEQAELTALRLFAGSVAFAFQLSRPMRTACLRHARIASEGQAHANLLRASPDKNTFTFRFAPWEIKNQRWINVDIVGDDAAILREWIEHWRPRMLELKRLQSVYLFPGDATPARDEGDPIELPRGCYATSSFLEMWKDAGRLIGFEETPHRMRHIVALMILASRPGDFARVASVLGNTEAVSREHYGRDDGHAAARETRDAMQAQHREIFRQLKRRHAREQ